MTEFEYTTSEEKMLRLMKRRKQWKIDDLTLEFYTNKKVPLYPVQVVSKLMRGLSVKVAANQHGRLMRTSRLGRGQKAVWRYMR